MELPTGGASLLVGFPVVVCSKAWFSKFGYKGPSENGHGLVLFPVRSSFLGHLPRLPVQRTVSSTHIKSHHASCHATPDPSPSDTRTAILVKEKKNGYCHRRATRLCPLARLPRPPTFLHDTSPGIHRTRRAQARDHFSAWSWHPSRFDTRRGGPRALHRLLRREAQKDVCAACASLPPRL